MEDFINTLVITICIIISILLSPFVVAHVIDNWNAPEYQYSGATPDFPEHVEPENTLPPVIE